MSCFKNHGSRMQDWILWTVILFMFALSQCLFANLITWSLLRTCALCFNGYDCLMLVTTKVYLVMFPFHIAVPQGSFMNLITWSFLLRSCASGFNCYGCLMFVTTNMYLVMFLINMYLVMFLFYIAVPHGSFTNLITGSLIVTNNMFKTWTMFHCYQ